MNTNLIRLLLFFFIFNAAGIRAQNVQGFCTSFGSGTIIKDQSVIQTGNGDFIVAGTVNADCFISKVAKDGNMIWSKKIDTQGGAECYSVRETAAGTYLMAGYATSSQGLYFVKIDTSGNLLGTLTYEYSPFDPLIKSMIKTKDNGYAVTGYFMFFSYELFVARFDSNLNPLWQKEMVGQAGEACYGNSIIQTSDGGFAIAGRTYGFSGNANLNAYIVKLDSLGDLQWTRTIGTDTSGDRADAIIQTGTGDYIISGVTNNGTAALNDIYLAKLDSTGNLLWTKSFDLSPQDISYSLVNTFDGGYAVGGSTRYLGAYRSFIIKFDSNDSLQWSNVDDIPPASSTTNCIIQTSDGGFAMAGNRIPNISLLKTDSFGMNCCMIPITFTQSSAGSTGTGGVLYSMSPPVAGTDDTITDWNITSTIHCLSLPVNKMEPDKHEINIFPNPSNGNFELTMGETTNCYIEIRNIVGQKVFEKNIFNTSKERIHLKNIPSGIYLLKVFAYANLSGNGGKTCYRKLIIEHD